MSPSRVELLGDAERAQVVAVLGERRCNHRGADAGWSHSEAADATGRTDDQDGLPLRERQRV